VVRRCLEDRRDDFFAALVEQNHPELRNQLINALQLGRGHQYGHSPRLIEAIVNDAANATADLDMAGSIDARPAGVPLCSRWRRLSFIAGYAAPSRRRASPMAWPACCCRAPTSCRTVPHG